MGGFIARIDPLQSPADQGRVLGRAGQRSDRVQTKAQRVHPAPPDAAHRCFQSHDAAKGRGDAHRTAGVGAQGRRDQPGGHGHGRAAAGASRDMGNSFPRIEGRALIVIDSHPAVGELDGLGFSEEDHSGPGQALYGPGIRPGHGVFRRRVPAVVGTPRTSKRSLTA